MTIDVNSHVETSSPTRAQEQTRPNRILSDKKREPKEPFTYNHKPVVTKINPRETARQKMARDTSQRTFGASIEQLDFSDNELNDTHGLHIVSMIKSQSERRDHELWLHSLRRSAAEDHLSN